MVDRENVLRLQERLQQAIIDFEDEAIQELTREALAAGLGPQEIILGGLAPGLEEVGRRYSEGEYFIPELVMCGNAMQAAMAILDPLIESQGARARAGRIVIGTVEGDLHDIGKNLVSSMLRGSGFEIHDLGVNVPAHVFVEQVARLQPDILALSALLLSTRATMREVVDALVEAGLRDRVRIIVGGAPVTQEYADSIGADGYGADAVDAAHVARRLMGERSAGG
jgi:corrinoid protein of di/trimethylamine methyltransferase